MWDLLSTCAENGIMLNESKFQFCSPDVDFAGLEITRHGVKPSEKIMRAIQDYPPPTDITKARAFFGLVNQVQWAYANSPRMAPFRELVKPHSSFVWTPELVQLFQESKKLILKQVEKGVRKYSTKRATCLQTDFCKDGIGYLLLQKFCDCSMDKAPLCCPEGWQLVFAGSRFTKGAEARYAPTEGEALAVAWALNHAHIFTKGCPHLIVSTDHKPLLGILNDRPMEEIKNPRILRLKEQMLQFQFDMKYNPGKWHRAPDALSRNAVPSYVSMLEAFQAGFDEEQEELPAIDQSPEMALAVLGPPESMTLDEVKKATLNDPEMELLKHSIRNGFGRSQNSTDPAIRSFFNVKEHLWIDRDMVIFKDRIVVPRALRQKVVKALHSAHQGTEGMRARAANSVYWPGLNASIAEVRKNCKFCDSIAPTQPREPLQPLPASQYPFQHVCADAFEVNRQQYLVIVDKFSGWLVVFHFKGSIKARHIVDSLRNTFHTYGAPTILYSDGGLAFTSQETKDFLKRWGVEHIVSSAHYPQSNGRAELGVKTAKRIITENVSDSGSLNTDAASRALLQYRNTPIQSLGLSPAQILYHRNLRDSVPTHPKLLRPHNQWLIAAENREKALRKKNSTLLERYNTFTKKLTPLPIGTRVLVQEHINKKRWNRTGVVVERQGRSYTIRMDGSGRIISRNRRFLKATTAPASDELSWNPPSDGYSNGTANTVSDDTSNPTANTTTHNSHDMEREDSPSNARGTTPLPVHITPTPSQRDIPIPRMIRRLLPHNRQGKKE